MDASRFLLSLLNHFFIIFAGGARPRCTVWRGTLRTRRGQKLADLLSCERARTGAQKRVAEGISLEEGQAPPIAGGPSTSRGRTNYTTSHPLLTVFLPKHQPQTTWWHEKRTSTRPEVSPRIFRLRKPRVGAKPAAGSSSGRN